MRALLAVTVAVPACWAAIRAGAARVEITPDLKNRGPVYMAGFGNNRVATGVHDDCTPAAWRLRRPQPLVLCGVDSIGLFCDDVDDPRAVKKNWRKQMPHLAHVVVAATHDHQAPDTMGLWGPPRAHRESTRLTTALWWSALREAARDAVRHMKPASVTLGQAHPSELDTFIHDDRPPEVHDAGVVVLRATT